ncbi:hypothetical protein [Pseudovibrio sp. SPO723]|uniref:hypothetical protein n=1 Tax=Nesiotobacter zosterae TaxID=392721 RepID=UPI0029C1EDDF|nr:hypothetical protein [Pseudovibrio sp. SPO723]MDX5593851.1 hypothetical protein [Pseudovibrio sp. SPO723]
MAPIKSPLKTAGISLLAGLLSCSSAFAEGAVLLTKQICANPADIMVSHWAATKGATDVFFMASDGTVSKVKTDKSFDDFSTVYISAHSSPENVGGIANADFATYFKAAHASTPETVFFSGCYTGSGNARSKLNAEYDDNINSLYGPKGPCALVGDGSAVLSEAKDLYDVTNSNNAGFNKVVDNIMKIWSGDTNASEYNQTGKNWQKACEAYTDPLNAAKLSEFHDEVLKMFVTDAATDPEEDSYNYGLLIKWNNAGTAFSVCGKEHDAC